MSAATGSGAMIGLMRSVDGGANWSELGGATSAEQEHHCGGGAQQRHSRRLGRSQRLLGGGRSLSQQRHRRELQSGGGTCRRAGDGAGFRQRQSNFFYAAVSATTATDRGVYTSDISGSTWTKVLAMDRDEAAKGVTGADQGHGGRGVLQHRPRKPEFNKITRYLLVA
jgi:hypothetical protein